MPSLSLYHPRTITAGSPPSPHHHHTTLPLPLPLCLLLFLYPSDLGQLGRGGRDLFGGQLIYKPTEFPINPELLQKIADRTGGAFYTAADREALEDKFTEILNKFEKTRIRDLANALKSELFPWFVLPAFLLFWLAGLLELTLLRRLA